jgi:hypothetical protein
MQHLPNPVPVVNELCKKEKKNLEKKEKKIWKKKKKNMEEKFVLHLQKTYSPYKR